MAKLPKKKKFPKEMSEEEELMYRLRRYEVVKEFADSLNRPNIIAHNKEGDIFILFIKDPEGQNSEPNPGATITSSCEETITAKHEVLENGDGRIAETSGAASSTSGKGMVAVDHKVIKNEDRPSAAGSTSGEGKIAVNHDVIKNEDRRGAETFGAAGSTSGEERIAANHEVIEKEDRNGAETFGAASLTSGVGKIALKHEVIEKEDKNGAETFGTASLTSGEGKIAVNHKVIGIEDGRKAETLGTASKNSGAGTVAGNHQVIERKHKRRAKTFSAESTNSSQEAVTTRSNIRPNWKPLKVIVNEHGCDAITENVKPKRYQKTTTNVRRRQPWKKGNANKWDGTRQ